MIKTSYATTFKAIFYNCYQINEKKCPDEVKKNLKINKVASTEKNNGALQTTNIKGKWKIFLRCVVRDVATLKARNQNNKKVVNGFELECLSSCFC